VEALADRPAGFRPEGAKPFESLAPLPEVIAASTGVSAAGKNTQALYEQMLHALGPEFSILREVPVAEHGDWIGRPIKELGIPAEVLIVLVRRADGTTVVPKGGTVLQQGDMLVVNEWEET